MLDKIQVTSGKKYFWHIPVHNAHLVTKIAAQYNISPTIAEVLLSRGYETAEKINDFLFAPEIDNVFHPAGMKDAEKAVLRIQDAIEKKEKILVSGDYDVDGITASSLMMACMIPLGAAINFFLPNRAIHGYGLSAKTIENAAKNGYTLIITVDNGITAHEAAQEAKKRGVDLIITDHHKPHATLPEAYAIVNPQQIDCPYPFKQLAGVGVSFKLMSLLYEKEGRKIPQKVYELLLLGTIADVVPLVKENRYFVRHCLQLVNKENSVAFRVLKTNGNVQKEKITATDIGFSITPQINALGRLEDPREAVKFLIGTDEEHIYKVGQTLFDLNETRKQIEKDFTTNILQKIKEGIINIEKDQVIIDASEHFPVGVIGLIASKLTTTFSRPALIFTITKDGIAKGSCRSTSDINIFNMLEYASDLLLKFGGHAQAAGLSLLANNIPALKEKLKEYIKKENIEFKEKQTLFVDAEINLSDVNHQLMKDMHYLEPFGHHNDVPLFVIQNVSLLYPPKLLKEAHVKIQIFHEGIMKDVIFFSRPELFSFFTALSSEHFSLIARASINEWNGKSTVQLIGIDVC
jgi:single-stranded-DNA-specific exonuclease